MGSSGSNLVFVGRTQWKCLLFIGVLDLNHTVDQTGNTRKLRHYVCLSSRSIATSRGLCLKAENRTKIGVHEERTDAGIFSGKSNRKKFTHPVTFMSCRGGWSASSTRNTVLIQAIFSSRVASYLLAGGGTCTSWWLLFATDKTSPE